ncbi:hypothetical protein [Alkalinema sp. FACHB-956]|uniref:hypothetical protein n=1 Tax=Alkalinema sp. FACHB-956 TaxID=2692768 RepID=UPI001687CA4B|nr:hypothetical protein [Alkalinema sp. FACHB-956]MBD2328868.1 hypothetical protein [Alkalinema sp. FACHB-956]
MRTDLEFRRPELFGPVVFRPEFNAFQEINAAQAWSLFFTGSQEDKALGFNPEIGRFFTNALIAIGVSGVLLATFFTGQ